MLRETIPLKMRGLNKLLGNRCIQMQQENFKPNINVAIAYCTGKKNNYISSAKNELSKSKRKFIFCCYLLSTSSISCYIQRMLTVHCFLIYKFSNSDRCPKQY